jgi:hypothetical protein
MTTTPGALPLNNIRQAAMNLMAHRSVVAVHVKVGQTETVIYRQDVSESDELACKVLRALRPEPTW